MATRKADVAELIAVRCGLEAERASDSKRQGELIAGPLWRRLLELTHDSDANLRRWAIEALRLGSPVKYRREVLGRLQALAEDHHEHVRRSARAALSAYQEAAQSKLF